IDLMTADHLPPGMPMGPTVSRQFGVLLPSVDMGQGFGLGFLVRTAQPHAGLGRRILLGWSRRHLFLGRPAGEHARGNDDTGSRAPLELPISRSRPGVSGPGGSAIVREGRPNMMMKRFLPRRHSVVAT